MIDQHIHRIREAHDLFVTEGHLPARLAADVRPQILRSWRRSKLSGADPARPTLVFNGDVDPASKLRLAASAVFERLERELDGYCMGVYLADAQGTTVHRWVQDPEMRRRLDRIQSEVGMSSCEEFVGTNGGGTAMEDKHTVQVAGPEHYAEALQIFTCASSPIFRPATKQIAGALTLTCRDVDTNHLLVPLVSQAAAEIGERLFLDRTLAERLLLHEFVSAGRRTNGPVVAITETMIMTNPQAARMLEGVDQTFLWEHAARAVHQRLEGTMALQLASSEVSTRCLPVSDGGRVIGVVIELGAAVGGTRVGASWRTQEERYLRSLAGHGSAWMRVDAAARTAARSTGPVLVRGEIGTGKRVVARSIAADVVEVDAATVPLDGLPGWSQRLRDALSGGSGAVLVSHLERLSDEATGVLSALIDEHGRGGCRVLATLSTSADVEARLQPLVDRLSTTVVDLPPLRDRLEDLPDLVGAFTRSASPSGGPTWSANALQALSRLPWPGNVRELEAMVRRMIGQRTVGTVTAEDLPAEARARTHRSTLTQMERAEVEAIVAALAEADGNKAEAAVALGISRSTLYRKLRGYGLDLDRLAF